MVQVVSTTVVVHVLGVSKVVEHSDWFQSKLRDENELACDSAVWPGWLFS